MDGQVVIISSYVITVNPLNISLSIQIHKYSNTMSNMANSKVLDKSLEQLYNVKYEQRHLLGPVNMGN